MTNQNSRDCKHGHLARSCEICELEAEVQRLQRALAFWLPGVPSSGSGRATRCGNDAMLLVGYPRGMELEPGAEDLGWITFCCADEPKGHDRVVIEPIDIEPA